MRPSLVMNLRVLPQVPGMVADSTNDRRVPLELPRRSACVVRGRCTWCVAISGRRLGTRTKGWLHPEKRRRWRKNATAMYGGGNALGGEAAGAEVAGGGGPPHLEKKEQNKKTKFVLIKPLEVTEDVDD